MTIKEAVVDIRKLILNATTSKPIGVIHYEVDLFFKLYPIMRGIVRSVRDRVRASELEPRIKEAAGDDWVEKMMQGAITSDHKLQIAAAIRIVGKDAAIAAGLNAAFKLAFPLSYENLQKKVLEKASEKAFKITTTQITPTLEKVLRDRLKTGYEKGWGTPKIAKSLTGIKTNAKTIARTEMNQIVQSAHFETTLDASDKMDYPMEKTWLTAQDPNVRDWHAAMDGETVEIDQPFSNGLMFPLDPAGSAEEVINCRCDIAYRKLGATLERAA